MYNGTVLLMIHTMFWRKREKLDWPLFVILLFGSIVLVIALVSVVSNLVKVRENADEIKTQVENTIQFTTPAEMEASYAAAMRDLRTDIEASDSADDMFARVEDVFLSVRVPTDRRQRHLETLLMIERLKEEGLTDEALRDRLLGLLQEL